MTENKLTIFVLFLVQGFFQPIFAQQPTSGSYRFPYNLKYSTQKWILPEELNEISGNAFYDDQTIICIQDEKGKLFFYDLKQKKITNQVKFDKDGDFEDIAIAGNSIYAVRSDGLIVEIENFTSKEKATSKEYWTPLSLKNDCEGICYDSITNSLLIALKELSGIKEIDNRPGFKAIYSFDLNTKKLSEKPAYLIEISKLENQVKSSSKTKKESTEIRFKPSAIAVHPVTSEIYVLGSTGKMLVVMSRKGDILTTVSLDKKLFPQPEGMTFSPKGALFISNEGDGGSGTLLKFEMK